MSPKNSAQPSGVSDQAEPVKRVVHVITGLKVGGAEMMLYKLLTVTPDAANSALVISLTSDGSMGSRIRSLGVPVRILNMSAHRPNPFTVLRLARWLKEAQPGVVQTWMYHADVIGGLAAKLADRRVPVVWNLRASSLDSSVIGAGARIFARISAWLSGRLPDEIISCSKVGAERHIAFGYPRARVRVIPNGFDLDHFRPDPIAREEIRSELGVAPQEILIGLVARFHPMKDHATFVRAARRLCMGMDNIRFLMCGAGVTWENVELANWIDQAGLRARFLLLGERSDINRINAGLDIATLTSRAVEGFPNALGEAMACGVPCVATNVGDSAFILSNTGRVIPPNDTLALVQGWQDLIALGSQGRQNLGQRALERIKENFNLPTIGASYAELYRSVRTRSAR